MNIIYNILQYEGYRNAWDTPSCIANLLSNLTVYTKKPSNKTCCYVSLFVIEGCSRKYDWTYISICKKHVKIYTTIARSDFLRFSIKSRMAEVGLHRLKMADRSDCRVSLAHRNAKRRYSTRLCRAYTCVRVCVCARAHAWLLPREGGIISPHLRSAGAFSMRFSSARLFLRPSPSPTRRNCVACAASAYFECPVREYQKLLIHSMPLRVCAACTRARTRRWSLCVLSQASDSQLKNAPWFFYENRCNPRETRTIF